MVKKCKCTDGTQPYYNHTKCKGCGQVSIDGGRDWKVAKNKLFKNITDAEFYRDNGRLPDESQVSNDIGDVMLNEEVNILHSNILTDDMKINIDILQGKLLDWINHNFPESTTDSQIKGLMEELGELCHADLKNEQKIRGYTDEKANNEIMDAIGDIAIYLINYCNRRQISFSECLNIALNTIFQRDWKLYRKDGTPE